MRAYVGITDGEWFELLRRRSDLEEVNFWKPGGKHRFRALQVGELFGRELRPPVPSEHRPSVEFLEWHNANIFRG